MTGMYAGKLYLSCSFSNYESTNRSLCLWFRASLIQRNATQGSVFIILQFHSTCFGFQPHPSTGVRETVTTASGTGHIFCAATSIQRGQASLATLEAVVTVLCTSDDGRGWHPKHVEWTCRIINRLLCVASRWTVINIDQRSMELDFLYAHNTSRTRAFAFFLFLPRPFLQSIWYRRRRSSCTSWSSVSIVCFYRQFIQLQGGTTFLL